MAFGVMRAPRSSSASGRYAAGGSGNHAGVNLRKVFAIFVIIQIVGWVLLLAMQNGIEGIVR
jgi:hypothetical protein